LNGQRENGLDPPDLAHSRLSLKNQDQMKANIKSLPNKFKVPTQYPGMD
jgi:hypothetical protein